MLGLIKPHRSVLLNFPIIFFSFLFLLSLILSFAFISLLDLFLSVNFGIFFHVHCHSHVSHFIFIVPLNTYVMQYNVRFLQSLILLQILILQLFASFLLIYFLDFTGKVCSFTRCFIASIEKRLLRSLGRRRKMVLGEGDKGDSVIQFFAFAFCRNNVSLCDRDTIFLLKF